MLHFVHSALSRCWVISIWDNHEQFCNKCSSANINFQSFDDILWNVDVTHFKFKLFNIFIVWMPTFFWEILYILDNKPLLGPPVYEHFTQSVFCLYIFFIMPFEMPRILILIRCNYFFLLVSYIIYDNKFHIYTKSTNQMSQWLMSIIFKSYIILPLTFRTLIIFCLFPFMVWDANQIHPPACRCLWFQHCLLERLFFLHTSEFY